jgi:high-affinity Fe2+/Pb2+ permease
MTPLEMMAVIADGHLGSTAGRIDIALAVLLISTMLGLAILVLVVCMLRRKRKRRNRKKWDAMMVSTSRDLPEAVQSE